MNLRWAFPMAGRGLASLAGLPNELIENPERALSEPSGADALSEVLRSIRLSGSLQFCFMPSGEWQTDDKPGFAPRAMPFHIVAEGSCWLRMGSTELALVAGDVVAFPFGTGHAIGGGVGGRLVKPSAGLPPKPWRSVPLLRNGEGRPGVRLLCGYLTCDAMNFGPLRNTLPQLIHVRTEGAEDARWLRETIAQITAEVDRPRAGSLTALERLTEVMFIELLRHQISSAGAGSIGWLAALADPALGRCLAAIHEDPARDWSLGDLAAASALSRSTLAERFEATLGTSPMRYVRDWRLYLASVALSTTSRPIAGIAYDAGYGTEAAFNRAFSRAYGAPPAAWRQSGRRAAQTA
jgi:AraC-like DNA-binding protein